MPYLGAACLLCCLAMVAADGGTDAAQPWRYVCRDADAGAYEAFPDVCRLANGDLLCVFYAGYGHVSMPNDALPRGGCICSVTSHDQGQTWGDLRIVFDGPEDDRDPHIAQLGDGTLVCTFFTLYAGADGAIAGRGSFLVRSTDGGAAWDAEPTQISEDWYISAHVHELPDRALIVGAYQEGNGQAWGGTIRSEDHGRTWLPAVRIPSPPDYYLDAETDLVRLPSGRLFAALRSSKQNMAHSWSDDGGRSWSEAADIGFPGHCPCLLRLCSGAVLMAVRLPSTSFYVSRDECETWSGPYEIDSVGGAYPGLAELPDGSVLAVYYEEGEGSSIRCRTFRVTSDRIE
jgi:sialidase-1